MISILLILKKNSKFFSKYLIGFLSNTENFKNVELLILANEGDTWNQDLFKYYDKRLTVYYEDFKTGKLGRALFYNELAKHAKGDWLWLMCADHYITKKGYDTYLAEELKKLNSSTPHLVMPKVENSGSISHILSRGWYEKTGRVGAHGSIDSYLNSVATQVANPNKIHLLNDPIIYDFTTDVEIMTPKHSEIELDYSITFPPFDSQETQNEVAKDAWRLNQ